MASARSRWNQVHFRVSLKIYFHPVSGGSFLFFRSHVYKNFSSAGTLHEPDAAQELMVYCTRPTTEAGLLASLFMQINNSRQHTGSQSMRFDFMVSFLDSSHMNAKSVNHASRWVKPITFSKWRAELPVVFQCNLHSSGRSGSWTLSTSTCFSKSFQTGACPVSINLRHHLLPTLSDLFIELALCRSIFCCSGQLLFCP